MYPLGLLLAFAFRAPTQVYGLTCWECTDVASPNDCNDTVVCGKEEICYTREITDANGVKGFHMGCEDKNTCSFMIPALTIFGKRDTSDVNQTMPEHCFQCCSTDECNAALCDMSVLSHQPLWGASAGVTCRTCKDVASPNDCRESMTCGQGEICYTREFTNHDGQQGFSMGCEAKKTCELLVRAEALFEETNTSAANTPDPCYECCASENCNTGLCSETVGSYHSSGISNKGCPPNFIGFKTYCYYVVPKIRTDWHTARSYCRDHRADLLSVHSHLEHWFLRYILIKYSDGFQSHFWTGGFYSHAAKGWYYVDRTSFDYIRWWSHSPPHTYSHDTDYYALLLNPKHDMGDPIYKNGRFVHTTSSKIHFAILCKKQRY